VVADGDCEQPSRRSPFRNHECCGFLTVAGAKGQVKALHRGHGCAVRFCRVESGRNAGDGQHERRMVMPGVASERSSACNKDALPDKPPKISPQRLSGFVGFGKYLNSIELGVWVDKLIPRGANWLLELEDVRGFGRVALSNILVVGGPRKDAVIQPALKGEGVFLFQVYACGIRRRCGADRQADRQEKAESSRHERTYARADWAAARRTRSRHARRTSSTTLQHRDGPATGNSLGRAASPDKPPALRIKNST